MFTNFKSNDEGKLMVSVIFPARRYDVNIILAGLVQRLGRFHTLNAEGGEILIDIDSNFHHPLKDVTLAAVAMMGNACDVTLFAVESGQRNVYDMRE